MLPELHCECSGVPYEEQHAELSSRKAAQLHMAWLRVKAQPSSCCRSWLVKKVFSFMDGSAEDAVKKEPWKQRNPFEKACASGEGPSYLALNLMPAPDLHKLGCSALVSLALLLM